MKISTKVLFAADDSVLPNGLMVLSHSAHIFSSVDNFLSDVESDLRENDHYKFSNMHFQLEARE